ncbi:hypothetical protein [Roseicella aquatilis]|uniref:Uncharacterized protein n=1 Tax=Roseicella aquatilis TaxID=2527868 RepID=A0A4R4DSS4_9PROT|nr:hypothetical protein [Roseicella aquatilis]TCZ64870.1 hypothetical protein EXY23_05725 [Roseicella aquatilis]
MPRKTQQPPARHKAAAGRAASGTPADRLVRAWLDEDYDSFEDLVEELIVDGRDGVFSAAVRKLSEKYEDEAVQDFAAALTELAEAAEGQEGFDLAQLVLLPAVTAGRLPDAAALAQGLAAAGVVPQGAETSFAEGWRAAEAVGALPPAAVRRVLLDIARGRPPADLPPLPPGELPEGEIVTLVGAVLYRTEPPTEDPDADPEVLAAAAEGRASELADAFERWCLSLPAEVSGGALILPLCAPSDLAEEIESLLEEVTADDPDLDEIIDFVETARAEAAGDDVVARLLPGAEGVTLTVLTRSGRELDSRAFALGENSLTVEAIRSAVERCVPVLDGPA